MNPPLVIFGASGHAAVVAEAARSVGTCVLGFVADSPSPLGLIGDEVSLPNLLRANLGAQVIVAIGDNHVRRQIAQRLLAKTPGITFASVVHRSATLCAGCVVSPGAFVAAGAVVGVDARVGEGAIVNTRASLDHHAELGAFASMAPASATGGRVRIGAGSAIGMGAMIHHDVTIGSDTVLGSLALANKNLGDCVIAIGNPARTISVRQPGDKYL